VPTILLILGWRLFFYSNEGSESIHVHCRKGNAECKYWLDTDNYDIEEAYAFELSLKERREIRRIIFEHFEYIDSHQFTLPWESTSDCSEYRGGGSASFARGGGDVSPF
jgi:hypothetical protein